MLDALSKINLSAVRFGFCGYQEKSAEQKLAAIGKTSPIRQKQSNLPRSLSTSFIRVYCSLS